MVMTDGTSITVLLVEDDAWLADVQTTVLEAAGFTVRRVAHATAAMTAIDEQIPDVLIVDMLLAGTTALTLLHELQSHPDTAGVPVIACTNVADSLESTRLEQYGIRRIVDKATMRPADLVGAVRSVL
jgi:two-component system, OmpR family, phosphate regulon response regulator PhoB